MTILIKQLDREVKRIETEQRNKINKSIKKIEKLLSFFNFNKDLDDICETLAACGITGLDITQKIHDISGKHRINAYKNGSLMVCINMYKIIYLPHELHFVDQSSHRQIDLEDYIIDSDMTEYINRTLCVFGDTEYTFLVLLEKMVETLKAYIPEMKEFLTNVSVSDYGYKTGQDTETA